MLVLYLASSLSFQNNWIRLPKENTVEEAVARDKDIVEEDMTYEEKDAGVEPMLMLHIATQMADSWMQMEVKILCKKQKKLQNMNVHQEDG